jgi:hypothetical protein
VLEYLEASLYRGADPATQIVMRKEGLMPANPEAKMPEPYRIWRICQQHNTLWWSGGISNQPYIMMLEFDVCAAASADFDEQTENYRRIINAKRPGTPAGAA